MLDDAEPALRESLLNQLARMPETDFDQVLDAASTGTDAARDSVARADVRRRYHSLFPDWERAVRRPRPQLEQALILLGRAAGVSGVTDVAGRLDMMAADCGDRLSGDRAFDVGLTVLAEVLGRRYNLRGSTDDYDNPANGYLQSVLQTGLGIPISLCTVAVLVGQRLELPVWGVGTPGHFLGFYGDAALGHGTYFDAFDGFRRLTQGDVRRVLSKYVDSIHQSMLKPVDEREIIARSMRNLIGMHEKHGQPEHAACLMTWHAALQ